ncbi:TM0106 family RecB-like putative nuclease [Isoptericola sp. NEAU-Y5]|uniref:TM0106 family RecB-like putative nuclease n=1 Tax=Isoptericola luteus TaxID=2879484 RepID=A0ABS7Z9Q7_9MICO|nr:TM0106 family RecB-like putative nuclease [Isoptericola sp. NEAU-Y5]MCA5891788.1 TM0106 family RecB-like putative nuclease [Isoptericola sp. NEAU-Y5]
MFLVTGRPAGGPSVSASAPAASSVVHSASDVVLAAECEHALLRRLDEVLGRAPRRERVADATRERTIALGAAHERRALEGYVERFGAAADGGGVVEIAPPGTTAWDELVGAHATTLAALEGGADVVAQASFFDGDFHGRADFLLRDDARPGAVAGAPGADGARPRYAVWEAKLARRAKVPALLQVAAYAEQLVAAGVDPTEHGHLLLGSGVESHHRVAELLPVFRARRDRLLEIVGEHVADDGPVAWGDPRYVACGRLGVCPDCAAAAAEHRDVLLVGGVYDRQRSVLAAGGITTIDALAAATAPVAGMAAGTFEKLRFQAGLQLGSEPGDGRVRYDVAGADGQAGTAELRWSMPDPSPVDHLPAPSPGDVFFDFEGDPMWTDPDGRGPAAGFGLDYLFGWVTRPGVDDGSDPTGPPPFHGLWADTLAQEREALVTFVDWLTERRRRWPDLHVYHYADYERSHLLSIAARHGTYEDEVDDLLRDGVLVDLWKVVRPALRISHRSRSIKKLEPLYMSAEPGREGVTDAAASIVEYAEYAGLRAAGKDVDAAERKAQILDYNRYDCVSTLRLLEWLRDARAGLDPGRAAAPGAGAAEVTVPPEVTVPAEVTTTPEVQAEAPGAVEPTARQLDVRRRLALETEIRAEVESASSIGPAESVTSVETVELPEPPVGAPEPVGTGGHAGATLQALSLLGAAVGYYGREAKPAWHEHFARLESPPDEWPGRRSAMAADQVELRRGWQVEPGRTVASRLVALRGRPVEGTELVADVPVWLLYDEPTPPAVGPPGPGAVRGAHRRARIVSAARVAAPASATPGAAGNGRAPRGDQWEVVVREDLRRTDPEHEALPMGVAVNGHVPTEPQEQAVEDAAATALAQWRADGRLVAGPAVDLLLRAAPRLSGGPLPRAVPGPDGVPDLLAAVEQAVRRLDRSFLAVQGPPGTGKTRLAAGVVAALVASGWRVGVVAQSHSVVENLLDAALGAGVPPDRVAKKRRERAAVGGRSWAEVDAAGLASFAAEAAGSGAGCLVGGTAWDFAHGRWPVDGLDLLVVDEAGQFSLANTVAVARSARRLLLLGDPQQLGQVSRGRHPEPAVAGSALGWLAGGRDVLPDRFGYFLPVSYRMHPALCREVSQLAYEGRLHAHPRAAARHLEGVEPGVEHVLVEHAGNEVASPEEAAEVVAQVQAVVGRRWTPRAGESRPLEPADVLVVAAYNAQVATVRRALDGAGLDAVRVGTVDLFQGQEAVVVILTLAASSAEHVPRGAGFLLDRHRINVAVSRGQWCARVVRSPGLTDFLPHGVRGVEQLGAFLRLGSSSGDGPAARA